MFRVGTPPQANSYWVGYQEELMKLGEVGATAIAIIDRLLEVGQLEPNERAGLQQTRQQLKTELLLVVSSLDTADRPSSKLGRLYLQSRNEPELWSELAECNLEAESAENRMTQYFNRLPGREARFLPVSMTVALSPIPKDRVSLERQRSNRRPAVTCVPVDPLRRRFGRKR